MVTQIFVMLTIKMNIFRKGNILELINLGRKRLCYKKRIPPPSKYYTLLWIEDKELWGIFMNGQSMIFVEGMDWNPN